MLISCHCKTSSINFIFIFLEKNIEYSFRVRLLNRYNLYSDVLLEIYHSSVVSTFIDILAGDNNFDELLQFQALYSLVNHTLFPAIFVLQLYEKPQCSFIVQMIPGMFDTYMYIEAMIVIPKLCGIFFYAEYFCSYLPLNPY